MDIAVLEAKDIAWQVKRADLASTVGQQLVAPRRAFDHLVDVNGGLGFSENLGAFAILQFARTDHFARRLAQLTERSGIFFGSALSFSTIRHIPKSGYYHDTRFRRKAQ